MKALSFAVLMTSLSVIGCTAVAPYQEGRTVSSQSQAKTLKVANIPSLKIEVLPDRAVCELSAVGGAKVRTQCLQYRQPFQKSYNTLAGGIEGFDFEPGYRYLLDIRQEAIADETGNVKPVWILNEIVSKIED